MQQMLYRLDYTSLGYESKKQKEKAAKLLLRLKPHSLEVFVPCLAEKPAAIQSQLKQLTTLVCGSSELLRHTSHCDVTRKMRDMYIATSKMVITAENVKKVKRIVPKITDEKFNSIMNRLKANAPADIAKIIK